MSKRRYDFQYLEYGPEKCINLTKSMFGHKDVLRMHERQFCIITDIIDYAQLKKERTQKTKMLLKLINPWWWLVELDVHTVHTVASLP